MRTAANRSYVVKLEDVEDILRMAEFEAYDLDGHQVVKNAWERLQQLSKSFLPTKRNERSGDKFAIGWNQCVESMRRNIGED